MKNSFLNKIKAMLIGMFAKTKKIAQIPQGEEYDNWLGV
jgi:hypothetical protein